MDASVRQDGDALVFGGTLDRAAVARLWPQLQAVPADTARLDLTAVEAVDSAGLALLVELRARLPRAAVVGSPPGLSELRAAYRLDEALAFAA
ncbi:STAS domain-containing protein [Cognatilysobacter tabacisoli]|uniref:STAS domain-containing protein n=1 Tax=Cognatilysobacter tabacisoli TaxID=2315424 RepID=UPI000E6B0E35|nr:STAS domain-containing protein [Lysobacter tabacisoli]